MWFEPIFFRNVVISFLFSVSTNFAITIPAFWRRILLWIKRLPNRHRAVLPTLSPLVLTALLNFPLLNELVVLLVPVRYPTPPKLSRCLGSTKKLFEEKI